MNHLRKSRPGKPQNSGRFSGGVVCLLILPQGFHPQEGFSQKSSKPGELLVGCGDGELVMVVEGAVKKPPPGRVTFPTQVINYFDLDTGTEPHFVVS